MLTFGNKIGIYEWFQQIQGWNRMDFLCNLIHLCNPFELRFIGSCIEDIAQMDYNCLRDQEGKANSAEHLEHFINKCSSVDEFRSHISVCISLLRSSNYKVASKLAELLDDKLDGLNLEHLMQAGLDAEVEQWLLMLTLASYHPAFSFEKKLNFKRKLSEYERLNKRERKGSRLYRGHRYPQSQHSASKYNDCEESNWRTDFNPSAIQPFHQHYPNMHHHRSYGHGGYSNFQPEAFGPGNGPQGVFQEGFSRSSNFMQRPTNFPNNLMQPSGMGDTNFYEKQMDYKMPPPPQHLVNFPPKPDFMSTGFTRPPRQERRLPHAGRPTQVSPTLWNEPTNNIRNSIPAQSSIFPLSTVCNIAEQNTTVSTVQCSNAASANSLQVSTNVVYQAQPRSTAQTTNSSDISTSSAKRHFITIPISEKPDNQSETVSNRTRYETQKSSLHNKNNFMPNHPTQRHTEYIKLPPKKSYSGNIDFSRKIQSSVTAPALSINEQEKDVPPESFPNSNEASFVGSKTESVGSLFQLESEEELRPVKVSVKIPQKSKKEDARMRNAACFNLKVDWSDGTTTDCEKNVDEMISFYKQMVGKLGKSSSNTEFLMKHNNKIVERRKELEAVFSEILTSSSSNIADVVSFFKMPSNNFIQATSTLPLKKRKMKSGPKYVGGIAEGSSSASSSSSSTASPPLSHNSRSQLLPAPTANRPEMSISPLSNNGGKSASSVLSSPASLATSTTTTSYIDDDDDDEYATSGDSSDPRNDPYLKLYYWLHDRSLSHLYTHLKKHTFQQFCKLRKSQIESITSIGTEEKAILNQHLANMTGNKSDTLPLEIDMGMLSLATASSSNSEMNLSSANTLIKSDYQKKSLDIKSILDEISRNRSEDEKSGSTSHSVPFEIPSSSNDGDQVAASNSCFSFEFDSTAATVETTPRSSKPASENEADIITKDAPFQSHLGNNRPIEPGRAWSQTDISPNDCPQTSNAQLYFTSKSAPPFPQMTYYAKIVRPETFPINPVVPILGCYHQPQTVTSRPLHIPHTGTTPVPTPVPDPIQSGAITLPPSTMGVRPPQYAYTVSTGVPPMTSEPAIMYTVPYYSVYTMTSPNSAAQNTLQPRENESNKHLTSSSSSDQDSAPKDLPLISAETVVANRPGVGHTSFYYNPAPPAYISGSFSSVPPQQNQFDFVQTNNNILQQNNNYSLPNGYAEPSPSVPLSPPSTLSGNRGTLPAESSTDVHKKIPSTSCYNCGRHGHEAAACTKPIAAEVLDFQLKMSQP
uniref:uncharacterized protein LOC120340742 n=1 Tax=Styela clava TaxID=7725 RepID=UPI001939EE4B|nr:uncharacterized protein LOC120340742 [Styela clava]